MTTYTITTFDPSGSVDTRPLAINASGQIVGGYTDSSGHVHGFLDSGGVFTTIDIDFAGSAYTIANGINDSGQIVAFSQVGGHLYGFVERGGYFIPKFGFIQGHLSINASGQVVGSFDDGHGFLYSGGTGFLDTGGTVTGFDPPGSVNTIPESINASGQIVGEYDDSSGQAHGFLRTADGTITTIDPSGSRGTEAVSINALGQIVGNYFDSINHGHGFLYSGGTITTIDIPGSALVTPVSINDLGQIVGWYQDSGGHTHGFLDSGGTITTIDPSGSVSTEALSINDSGQIVGLYEDSSLHEHGFLATAATAPTVVADRTGVNVGASVTADAAHGVLANDTDPIAGDTLHVSAVNGQPVDHTITIAGTLGKLTLNADGSYTYSAPSSDVLPPSGVGQDVFTYTASTGQGGTANSTLTVTVTAAGLNFIGGVPGGTITGPDGHSPVLDGGGGNTTLIAGNGATVLIGGPGDTLTGAKGADTYVFTGDFGANLITNYNPDKDVIELDHNEFANLNVVMKAALPNPNGTVITDPTNSADTITLLGVSPSQLHFDTSHFLLV